MVRYADDADMVREALMRAIPLFEKFFAALLI
jgi:hypothetical protein